MQRECRNKCFKGQASNIEERSRLGTRQRGEVGTRATQRAFCRQADTFQVNTFQFKLASLK